MSTWYNNAEVQRTVASFFIKRPGATVADLIRHMEACDKVRPSARHIEHPSLEIADMPSSVPRVELLHHPEPQSAEGVHQH